MQSCNPLYSGTLLLSELCYGRNILSVLLNMFLFRRLLYTSCRLVHSFPWLLLKNNEMNSSVFAEFTFQFVFHFFKEQSPIFTHKGRFTRHWPEAPINLWRQLFWKPPTLGAVCIGSSSDWSHDSSEIFQLHLSLVSSSLACVYDVMLDSAKKKKSQGAFFFPFFHVETFLTGTETSWAVFAPPRGVGPGKAKQNRLRPPPPPPPPEWEPCICNISGSKVKVTEAFSSLKWVKFFKYWAVVIWTQRWTDFRDCWGIDFNGQRSQWPRTSLGKKRYVDWKCTGCWRPRGQGLCVCSFTSASSHWLWMLTCPFKGHTLWPSFSPSFSPLPCFYFNSLFSTLGYWLTHTSSYIYIYFFFPPTLSPSSPFSSSGLPIAFSLTMRTPLCRCGGGAESARSGGSRRCERMRLEENNPLGALLS